MWLSILVLVITLYVLLIAYFRKKCSYWNPKLISVLPRPIFPWGHITNPLSGSTTNMGIHMIDIYHYFKYQKEIHGGIYVTTIPVYIPVDLDLIKQILIKDFNHFDQKGLYYNETSQPISAHMFQIGGDKWRNIRQKVSPIFTSGKLKGMFPIIRNCAMLLTDFIAHENTFDIKRVSTAFTIDVIGNVAFGLEIKSLKNEQSEFYKFGMKIFATDKIRALGRLVTTFLPHVGHALGIVNHYRDVEAFFTSIVTEIVQLREENQAQKREDFINLLIELKRNGKGIGLQDIITQSFLFFAAGFETSSNTISHCLFETAQQPEIQYKIKLEIDQVLKKHGGQLTYEGVQETTYLSQVIEETLRKYPALAIITRECSHDYPVPETSLTLEKGTKVFVPTIAIHWDTAIYPRPHVFNPERFSAKNKKDRHPCSWLGFGEGPRQCIGLRLALLQTKIALISLFKEYNFKLHEDCRKPLTFSQATVLGSKEQILLEKQNWVDTDIDSFLKEERMILKDVDITTGEISRLLQYGEVPYSMAK